MAPSGTPKRDLTLVLLANVPLLLAVDGYIMNGLLVGGKGHIRLLCSQLRVDDYGGQEPISRPLGRLSRALEKILVGYFGRSDSGTCHSEGH